MSKKLSARVLLGKTGLEVCRMGMGGIPIQRLRPEESDRVIAAAVEAGIDFFDTARIYTDSEVKLGRVLANQRGRVVIASKTFSRDAAGASRDLEESLCALRTDFIDLYQCHNIASEGDLGKVLAADGALTALSKAQEMGKIRHIGLSSHKPWMVRRAVASFPFATVQIPFNYMETAALDELLPYLRRRKIGIIAMKPLGGGNIRCRAANFRFIFQSGVTVAIPGMDAIEQVGENLAVLAALQSLTAAETAELDEEKKRLGDSFCRRCEYCLPCPQGLPIAFLHVLRNYYFLYDLKDWVMERLGALAKSYRDCAGCRECVAKCPYGLDSPEIFRVTWERIKKDRGLA